LEDFEEIRRGHLGARCRTAVDALKNRGFGAAWFPDAASTVEAALEILPAGCAVGAGGSVTLREIGLLERLEERGEELVFHSSGMDPEESVSARKQAIGCPCYVTSSNAITLEGELVNTDGIGNRVAGMIFGPDLVVVIAGANKLVADRRAAFSRIRNVAAPANARRLGINVPCAEKGYCVDCAGPMNICRVTTIISRKPMLTDIHVLIAAEPLGL
jgi:hypothetical protein